MSALDLDALAGYRVRVDPTSGVREEFVDLVLAGTRTYGVMAGPTGPSQAVGWVICHSFGLEQMNLDRVDVIVARALAAAGFPVLRFDAPGYGDSARRGRPVDVESHLQGSLDAVRYLSERAGVERVGVMGARFGGMLAAIVADRLDLPALAVWQPFVRGRDFIRNSMQAAFLTEMLKRSSSSASGLMADLERQGWSDVNGFVLTKETYDAVCAVDVTRDIRRFRGAALVVGISESGAMPPQAAGVAAHLRSLGATCQETPIADTWATIFGQHQYRTLPGGETEVDMQAGVSRAIAEVMVRWARATVGTA